MKEISEEKAIDVVKQMVADGQVSQEVAEKYFPELKEPEDERIRKAIHIYLDWLDGRKDYAPKGEYTIKDMIAWLEKQGEHANFRNKIEIGDKVTRNEDGVLVNLSQLNRVAKPADKVIKPKFRKGEWIVHRGNENIYQVVAVIDNQYQLKYGDNYTVQKCADVDRCARLWDIAKDAKDGDVLANDHHILILKELDYNWGDDGTPSAVKAYCGIKPNGNFEIGKDNWCFCGTLHIHPATKEQRDTLMKAMADAGYTFDFEKKELKKVEPNSAEDGDLPEFESYLCLMFQKFRTKGMCTNGEIIDYVKEHSQKLKDILVKPAWSEEDEDMFKSIIATCELAEQDRDLSPANHLLEMQTNWLKSLKERVQPQPKQEWGEEDEDIINKILCICDDFAKSFEISPASTKVIKEDVDKIDNWLKSLKDRYTWRPSDEQMRALNYVVNLMASSERPTENDLYYNILKSLRQQLKKLMEE